MTARSVTNRGVDAATPPFLNAFTIHVANERQDVMNLFRQALTRALQLCGIVALGVLQPPPAQAQQPRPELLSFISLAEARVIIDGAIAFARQSNMSAAVVDVSGVG
jgi:hypothetical protein